VGAGASDRPEARQQERRENQMPKLQAQYPFRLLGYRLLYLA
jgi:hypothetical protein